MHATIISRSVNGTQMTHGGGSAAVLDTLYIDCFVPEMEGHDTTTIVVNYKCVYITRKHSRCTCTPSQLRHQLILTICGCRKLERQHQRACSATVGQTVKHEPRPFAESGQRPWLERIRCFSQANNHRAQKTTVYAFLTSARPPIGAFASFAILPTAFWRFLATFWSLLLHPIWSPISPHNDETLA